MASKAFSGIGTAFKRSDMSSSPNFTAIAEVNSIGGPDMSRDPIDVTSLDSVGGYKEFIAGLRDGGEVVLEMNFTRDGYIDMKTDFETQSLVDYQIILPDTNETQFDFSGLVTALGMAVPAEDKVTASVTIKISGQTTITS